MYEWDAWKYGDWAFADSESPLYRLNAGNLIGAQVANYYSFSLWATLRKLKAVYLSIK
jgi:hypothetical protein